MCPFFVSTPVADLVGINICQCQLSMSFLYRLVSLACLKPLSIIFVFSKPLVP